MLNARVHLNVDVEEFEVEVDQRLADLAAGGLGQRQAG